MGKLLKRQSVSVGSEEGNRPNERMYPQSRAFPIPKGGNKKRPFRERDKPLIKRDEYGAKASILSGSKIANDLMQRGLLRKELYDDRIKVLKCADEGQRNISNFKPEIRAKCSDMDITVESSAVSSAEASGNTRKRKALKEWPQNALEKSARSASTN